ncbi:ABC transporter ATP-binding protein [Mesoplasma seiffertii]|uniref:ABC transporter ATP-binding protein n=1 Tax=Mesoplasma seiffertii TaxID=28224 RepID=UPI00055F53AD|nr:ABC transporter ATP-binding protein/permease [Mesoplasma seiffertii]
MRAIQNTSTSLPKNKDFTESLKLRSKGFWSLWFHYWVKHRIKAFFCVLFIFLVSAFSVFNIFIAQQITAILTAESLINTLNNKELLALIIGHYVNDPDIYQALINFLNSQQQSLDYQVINQILNIFYFSFIYYDGSQITTMFLGMDISRMQWIYILISNIVFLILFMYAAYSLCGLISEEVHTDLKNKLIASLLLKNIDFYENRTSSELIEIITKDSKNISDQFKVAPIIIIYMIFASLGALGMLFYIDMIVTSLMIGLMLIIFCILLLVVFLIANPVKQSLQNRSKTDAKIVEKILAIRLIKTSGTWNEEINNFQTNNNQLNQYDKKLNFGISIIPAIVVGAVGCLALSSIVFGVFVYNQDTTKLITVFSSFTAGVIVMITPIFQLNTILQSINTTNNSAKNISDICDTNNEQSMETSLANDNAKINIEKLSFKNVSFAYPNNPEKPIIKNLTIKFEQNKTYAFVGPSGCGKSTVTKLLLKFYKNYEGKIIVNGDQDLNAIDTKTWVDSIGYVDQEPQILSGTVLENILYAKKTATTAEVISACKKASIHELIMSWPDRYNTVLSEQGSQLSGGQKQRLVIARMFLKNPSLLILDEATSALDNISEQEIIKELNKLFVGKTVITVAHRLNTVKNYDQIFVFNAHQEIAQQGTFEELIKMEGLFRELYLIENS